MIAGNFHLRKKTSGNSDRSRVRALVIIMVFAALLSLSFAFRHHADTPRNLGIDATDYSKLAMSILTNHTYVRESCFFNDSYYYDSTHRAPGYPAYLAVIYAFFGENVFAVYVSQCLLLVITLLFIYLIFLKITNQSTQALICVGLCALWPFFYIDMIATVLPEIWSAFLISASVYLLLLVREDPKPAKCLLLGCLMAATALTKVVFLPFVVLAPCFILFSGHQKLYAIKMTVLTIFAAGIIIGSWCTRTYIITGAVVPITTGGGFNLWLGNHPDVFYTNWDNLTIPNKIGGISLDRRTTVEKDRIMFHDALMYMRHHPWGEAKLLMLKFVRLWSGEMGTSPRLAHKHIYAIGNFGFPARSYIYTPVSIAAIWGWFLLPLASRKKAYPLLLLFFVWTAGYVATYTDMRYASPLQFYIIAFAAVAFSNILIRFARFSAVADKLGCK